MLTEVKGSGNKVISSAQSRSRPGAGVWVPRPVVQSLCRLCLRPASVWPILLSIMFTQYRYGGKYAGLEVADITEATGLSRSTVKRALSLLLANGVINRPQRTGCVVATVGGPRSTIKNPRLNKLSRRKAQHDEPSPISHITLLGNQCNGFTYRQESAIRRTLKDASDLLGADAGKLCMPKYETSQLGLMPGVTYEQAKRQVLDAHNPRRMRDYVGAVKRLLRDERIQGRELRVASDE